MNNTPNDEELTACYREANGEMHGKAQPLTTQRIFRAMRAAIVKWGTPPAEQQVASSAVLKAIREANMQLVRTGDDAFMLVPYKAARQQEARPCHVFNVRKAGRLTEWEPTTMALALPDGAHALYTLPQPSPHAQADSVLEDAARLDWLALAGPVSICVVIDRPHDGEVEVSTDDVTGYGKTLREAIDAALAAQGGKV